MINEVYQCPSFNNLKLSLKLDLLSVVLWFKKDLHHLVSYSKIGLFQFGLKFDKYTSLSIALGGMTGVSITSGWITYCNDILYVREQQSKKLYNPEVCVLFL